MTSLALRPRPPVCVWTAVRPDHLPSCPQFKESALRKQSLYLKFDPLLRDSPRGPVPVAMETSRCARQPSPTREALSVGRLEAVPRCVSAQRLLDQGEMI